MYTNIYAPIHFYQTGKTTTIRRTAVPGRLASLGIMGAQLRTLLEHLITMVSRGLRGPSVGAPPEWGAQLGPRKTHV